MARPRRIDVAALNIKMHPHSHDRYIQLIQIAYQYGIVGKIRGDDFGMLGSLKEEKWDGARYIHGYLYKFLNINPEDPWLDFEKRQPILSEKGDPIPQVPEHLKPNLRTVRYVFDPRYHRLFFEAHILSPGSARRLFSGIFADRKILKKYGPIDVELETSQEALERILKIPKLMTLEIIVTRPNQDDISGEERRILERLEKQRARKLEEKLSSVKSDTLRPDEETRGHMKAALSNGRVTGRGYDQQDQRVVESTESHPMIERALYDPNRDNLLEVFLEAVQKLLRRIRRRE